MEQEILNRRVCERHRGAEVSTCVHCEVERLQLMLAATLGRLQDIEVHMLEDSIVHTRALYGA